MFEPPPPTRPAGVTITSILLALPTLTALLKAEFLYLRLILKSDPWQPRLFSFYLLYFLAMTAIEPTILFFFWRGREWARWVVISAAIFTLLTTAPGLLQPAHGVHLTLTAIAELLAAAFLLYYLNTRPIRAWFQ